MTVRAAPLAHLEYDAYSESAGVPTHYVIEVFPVALDPAAARERVTPRAENRWVTRGEISAERTKDGTRVSPTVELILTQLGL